MEVDKALRVGQLVEVHGRGREFRANARLASVDDRSFALTHADESSLLKKGDRVVLRLLTQQGVFSGETVVTGLASERVIVRKPSRFDRMQRREYLRVAGALSARFSYQLTPIDALRQVRCTTIDVSAGGLRLQSETQMALPPRVGQLGEIALTLDPGEPPVRAKARVLRFHVEGGEFIVQFAALADKERTRITRYVNSRQVELHQRR